MLVTPDFSARPCPGRRRVRHERIEGRHEDAAESGDDPRGQLVGAHGQRPEGGAQRPLDERVDETRHGAGSAVAGSHAEQTEARLRELTWYHAIRAVVLESSAIDQRRRPAPRVAVTSSDHCKRVEGTARPASRPEGGCCSRRSGCPRPGPRGPRGPPPRSGRRCRRRSACTPGRAKRLGTGGRRSPPRPPARAPSPRCGCKEPACPRPRQGPPRARTASARDGDLPGGAKGLLARLLDSAVRARPTSLPMSATIAGATAEAEESAHARRRSERAQ